MPDLARAGEILAAGVADGAFPAASAEVGTRDEVVWTDAYGRLDPASGQETTTGTVFDLASLTKVIATTTLVMRAVDEGRIGLADRVRRWLPAWRGSDRDAVSIEDLLTHSAGLTAHLPFHRDHRGRAEFEHAICTLPLEYPPRTRALYSDLGFMLLGFILADTGGGRPLDRQFQALAESRRWGDLRFRPPAAWRPRTAPTEFDTWRGRLARGEVHDENAWALGGVAGHAGLFGSVRAIGAFARDLLRARRGDGSLVLPATLIRFLSRSAVPGNSRALGWDTMLPTSSCGTRMSPEAVGHTGFTGTSLWLDPRAGAYVALLTNRVHPTRANDAILAVRPAFHDAVMLAIAG